jgi:hypothetical protein
LNRFVVVYVLSRITASDVGQQSNIDTLLAGMITSVFGTHAMSPSSSSSSTLAAAQTQRQSVAFVWTDSASTAAGTLFTTAIAPNPSRNPTQAANSYVCTC